NAIPNGSAVSIGTSTTTGTLSLLSDETVGAVTLVNGSITGLGWTLTGTSYDVQEGTISAYLGGAGVTLTKNATTVSGGTNIVTLSGVNTYDGTTTIIAGELDLSGGSSIVDTGAVILSTAGGALKLFSGETIGSLSGVSGTSVLNSGF